MAFTDAETVPNIPNNPGGPPERLGSGDIEYGSDVVKSLFRRLIDLGVVLSVDGDGRLAIDAPAGVLSDDLLSLIRSQRDQLLALVEGPGESFTLGPGWLCPWCRLGDRLAPAEPEGLRCDRCDRLAWRFLVDGIERCDWVEPILIDAPEPNKQPIQGIAPEKSKKRPSVVDRVGRSLFDASDMSG